MAFDGTRQSVREEDLNEDIEGYATPIEWHREWSFDNTILIVVTTPELDEEPVHFFEDLASALFWIQDTFDRPSDKNYGLTITDEDGITRYYELEEEEFFGEGEGYDPDVLSDDEGVEKIYASDAYRKTDRWFSAQHVAVEHPYEPTWIGYRINREASPNQGDQFLWVMRAFDTPEEAIAFIEKDNERPGYRKENSTN